MSRYETDKALWQWIREPAMREALRDDPAAYFAERDVTHEERLAIEEGDIRALYTLGAIPFLIYQYAIGRNRGVNLEFLGEYVAKLEGCEPADITT